MFTIILAGSDIGAPESGTGAGPDHVMDRLKLDQFEPVGEVIRVPVNQEGLERGSNDQTLNFIIELNRKIKTEVKKVLTKGQTPLVFHGDDSLIIGTGMALLEQGLNLGLLYFDAHGDINTPETSPSGCLFGMGVAHMMGLGFDQVLAINKSENHLQAGHIRFIGTRNFDRLEGQFVKDQGIRVIEVNQVRSNLESACKMLKIGGVKDIYIHIDQDVVDPTLSGASLCREPEGLFPEELYEMLRSARAQFNIQAVSFGNYKPNLDKSDKTLNIIAHCLKILKVN